MERYIGQKADQALEAMCGGASLENRVKTAKMYFLSVSEDHFLKSAPEDIQDYITKLMKADVDSNPGDAAALVKGAILAILLELGRQDGASEERRRQ